MDRFCPECGTKREGDASFCASCGHAFADAETAATAASDPIPAKPASPAPAAVRSSGERFPRSLIIAGAVIALLLVAAALWWSGVFGGSGGASASGDAAVDTGLIPVAIAGKCGFVDQDGKMVINPAYGRAGFFVSDLGLAPVEVDGKWGLIDRSGHYTLNPQFDGLEIRGNPPTLYAKSGEKLGIIDAKGNFVVNPLFDLIGNFDAEGRAVFIQNGKRGMIDRTGKFILQPQYEQFWGEKDDTGLHYFREGLALVQMDGKWGFIDTTGKWVINPQYDFARPFSDAGLAPVRIDTPAANGGKSERRWGAIDTTGKMVIQPQFDALEKFAGNGLAPAELNSSWGFVDKTGKMKINPQFADAYPYFSTSYGWLARAAIVSGVDEDLDDRWLWGLVDEKGHFKVPAQFTEIEQLDSNGRAVATVGEMRGLVDGDGKLVVNPVYAQIARMPGSDRYLFYRKGAANAPADTFEIGEMDRDGKVLLTTRGGICRGVD